MLPDTFPGRPPAKVRKMPTPVLGRLQDGAEIHRSSQDSCIAEKIHLYSCLMRRFLAIFAVVVLVTLVTGCALSSCAVAADSAHSCCHKHMTPETRQCAYSILEHSETTPLFIVAILPAVALAGVPKNPGQFQPTTERLADLSDPLVSIRVLRI